MAKFRAGETVVATENIGGVIRDSVPRGTQGVVVESGWGKLRVKFSVKGFLGSEKSVVIDVHEGEIR